jgi:hypothetical protein
MESWVLVGTVVVRVLREVARYNSGFLYSSGAQYGSASGI